MSEVTEQQLEDMEALFVQTAASMTSDRGTIRSEEHTSELQSPC